MGATVSTLHGTIKYSYALIQASTVAEREEDKLWKLWNEACESKSNHGNPAAPFSAENPESNWYWEQECKTYWRQGLNTGYLAGIQDHFRRYRHVQRVRPKRWSVDKLEETKNWFFRVALELCMGIDLPRSEWEGESDEEEDSVEEEENVGDGESIEDEESVEEDSVMEDE
ncbi:MAG: hypothetical protein Q9159_006277 [Coniocarpon cinnabarinum]